MQCLTECVPEVRVDEMPNAQERLAALEERVKNNIWFFRIVGGGMVCWLAWISVQVYRINGNVQQLVEPQRLESLAQTSPQKAWSEIASANPRILSKSLPALQTVVSQPTSEIRPAPESVFTLAQKLRRIPESSTDYWPTVLRFIQFASAGVNTTNIPPPGSPQIVISNVTCVNMTHCIVASGRRILLDGGSIPNSQFVNCRIIFTQNPVNMKGTVFINCVFEMPIVSQPGPYLRDASRLLLASDFQNITIRVSLG